jgi:hypothetical protein
VVLDKVRQGEGNFGYNAATGEYGDMIEMGILDPAKVTRTALQAAGSVAGLMITTEVMIADAPEDKGGPGHARRHAGHGRHGRHGWHDVSLRPCWRHELPVDQVPERFQVLRAGVAVVDVVGVLPDVDGQQRRDALRQRAAGVAGVVDGHGAVGLLHQPGPAGAEVVDREP